MGHQNRRTDVQALERVAAILCGLPDGCRWPRDGAPGPEFDPIVGQSFGVSFAVIPDRADLARFQVLVRFQPPRGPVPNLPWTLWVRCDTGKRPDRFDWRGLRKELRPEMVRSRQGASSWERTEFLWIAPASGDRDQDDTAAQIAAFLMQIRLGDSLELESIRNWLEAYLLVKRKLSVSEESEVMRSLTRYHRPPTAQSWPAFIRVCRATVRKGRAPRQAGGRRQDGKRSVMSVARELGIPSSTLYEALQQKRVPGERVGKGQHARIWIGGDDFAQLRAYFRGRPRTILGTTTRGAAYEADRKWIQRKTRLGWGPDKIREEYRKRKQPRPRLVKRASR